MNILVLIAVSFLLILFIIVFNNDRKNTWCIVSENHTMLLKTCYRIDSSVVSLYLIINSCLLMFLIGNFLCSLSYLDLMTLTCMCGRFLILVMRVSITGLVALSILELGV